MCLRLKFAFIPTPACATRFVCGRDESTCASPTSAKTRLRKSLRALAWILVARLLGKRVPTIHDRVYRDYSLTPSVMRSSDLARRGRGRKMISSAQGEVYDLDRMFAKLNRSYFDGADPEADDYLVATPDEEHPRSSRPHLRQHHDQQDARFDGRSGVVCRVHPLSRDAAHQTSGTFDQRTALLSHQRFQAG